MKLLGLGRGILTPSVAERGAKAFGCEISIEWLRLLPFIDLCLRNTLPLRDIHASPAERAILAFWVQKGWITSGVTRLGSPGVLEKDKTLRVSEKFFMAMQEVLWLAYISKEGGPELLSDLTQEEV